MTKGAFISKWLEQGERNTSYFFSLGKRNQKRNNIATLNVDLVNQIEIAKYVEQFYIF